MANNYIIGEENEESLTARWKWTYYLLDLHCIKTGNCDFEEIRDGSWMRE